MFHVELYNLARPSQRVDLYHAVFNPLGHKRGLFMPTKWPRLDASYFDTALLDETLQETALTVFHNILHSVIDKDSLEHLVRQAFTFPAPVHKLTDHCSILELFHGPTLAFKDFGARFMSRLMKYLRHERGITEKLFILAATSGDTGGAVASGFQDVEGIEVVLLYPKDMVSRLQEKQLTTMGPSVMAIEVNGTFDDCQRLVKDIFMDEDMNEKMSLSSANSINIARLIPQSLYYFEAYKQLVISGVDKNDISFCVPSGNYGNLCAGLIAAEMGLPVKQFIAANNANDPVVDYYKKGEYVPRPAKKTLSNAMDIGDPSNYPRLDQLVGSTWNNFKNRVTAFSFNDTLTVNTIKDVHSQYKYVLDPHTAVGYLAAQSYLSKKQDTNHICVLGTAHPCKFLDETQPLTNVDVPLPASAQDLFTRTEKKHSLQEASYEPLKKLIQSRI